MFKYNYDSQELGQLSMESLKGLSMEQLNTDLRSISIYLNGCMDVFNIIGDVSKKTLDFYNKKIELYESEIVRRKNG